MLVSRFSKFAASFILVARAVFRPRFRRTRVGSSNTATADPPVPHPNTNPCKVVLFSHDRFADFNPQTFLLHAARQCPAPWAKVILVADFSVTKGIQYDRTANIWLGPTNIYFGTTSEPDPNDSSQLADPARPHRLQLHLHHAAGRHRRSRQHRQQNLHRRASTDRRPSSFIPSLRASPRPSPPTRSSVSPADRPEAPSLSATTGSLPRARNADSAHQHRAPLFRRLLPKPERRRILVHLRPQRRRR